MGVYHVLRPLALVGSLLLGCTSGNGRLADPAAPLTPPTKLCGEPAPNEPCRTVSEVEGWLRDPNLAILGVSSTPGGMQGAKVFTLAVPRGTTRVVFRAKWRSYASGGLINDPRKELGAYAVQKLFLEPHQAVVPPTTGRCFDLPKYKKQVERSATATFEGTSCVFGVLSYWLENVKDVEAAEEAGILDSQSLYDEDLFEHNPTYRRSVADVNLLSYLVRHGDAHGKQFLLTTDTRHRAYTVDNSIAFESIKNVMLLFREDWSQIQVPALARESIYRLASLKRADLDALTVVEQYENRGGQLVPVAVTPEVGADAGVRWVGQQLKVGLTATELGGVWTRTREIVQRVRKRELRTF